MYIQLSELRMECTRDPLIGAIVSACARNRQSALTTLVWCQRHLEHGLQVPRPRGRRAMSEEQFKALVLAFRALERTGFGQLLQPGQVGRARFRWSVMPLVLERLVQQPEATLQPSDLLPAAAELGLRLPPPVVEEEAVRIGWARHEVTLRPGVAAEFHLPEDLTAEEAEWLGVFLRRLVKQPATAGAASPE